MALLSVSLSGKGGSAGAAIFSTTVLTSRGAGPGEVGIGNVFLSLDSLSDSEEAPSSIINSTIYPDLR